MADVLSSVPLYVSKSSSWNALQILLMALGCTFLAWYVQFHWKRRRMYKMAKQIRGPWAFPLIGSGLRFMGDPAYIFNNIKEIFEEYPDIMPVWFGTTLFYGVSKPDYLEVIMNSPKAFAKTDLYKYAQIMVGTGLFTAPVAKWKRHRKIIMPTFNQKILDQFVEIFAEKNGLLTEKLKEHAGKGEFDIFTDISKCTLNIICETAMGVKVGTLTANTDFGHWIDKALEITFLRMFVIWYHFDFIFKWTKLATELDDIIDKMHKFTGDIVTEKRVAYEKKMADRNGKSEAMIEDDAPKRKGFLDLLIELSSEGAKFTDEEMREEVDTFVIAGSDTTASSSCFLFIMLGMHPEIQTKVYEEVIDVIGMERPVEHGDLPQLKYTERVIKETLRLFPVGAFVVRNIEDDIQLDKCTLPAGSSAVLCFYHVHRNAEYWPNPLKFDPDRFLPEISAARHPYAYLPFSGGPRNCIGPKYAMMALKTMIATVVRKYTIHTAYKTVEDVQLKTNLMLRPKDGYKISVELRN